MKLERHRKIQELLATRGECSVEYLAGALRVSDMTIRRDLQQLADDNRLVRTHGGASPLERVSFEFQFLKDSRQAAVEKEAIGRRAAALVEDGQSVMLDSGTTTLAIARHLATRKRLVVITSSLPIAAVLQRSSAAEVILLGGIVRRDAPDLAGPLAEANLDAFRADIAFVGVDGVSLEGELYNASLTVGRLISKMTTRAASVYAIADSTKVGRTALASYGNAKNFDGLITDSGIARGDRRALERAGVRVMIAEEA